jgi:membrane protein YdbS with pleckstrin-like domain
VRRERVRNRLLETALIVLGVYSVVYYAFDPPSWVKLVGGVVLIVAWVCLYFVAPVRRRILRGRAD